MTSKSLFLLVIFASCLVSLLFLPFYITFHHLETSMTTTTTIQASMLEQFNSSSSNFNSINIKSPAQRLVEKAYRNSYKILVDACSNTTSTSSARLQKDCMQQILLQNNNNNIPWWLSTLLRDSMSLASAHWHYLDAPLSNATFHTPPLSMCTIEKTATTQWRIVFDKLVGKSNYLFQKGKTNDHILKRTYTWVVFRDPLERYLSAYLNKCFDELSRGFCKPNSIMNNTSDIPKSDELRGQQQSYLGVVQDNPKQHFEAYVSIMPLKWDIHFFPQSLACGGLYRYLHTYDDVLYMGDGFQNDLKRLGEKVGGDFPSILSEVFPDDSHSSKQGGYHATGASLKMTKYYTPESLRKVLQYTSIDYMTLGLQIPSWAEEMLRNDDGIERRK